MTTKHSAQIDASQLRAMSHLAATKDVRFYLNGVYIEARPAIVLQATDGTKLGMLKTGACASSKFTVLVPNDVLMDFCKHRGEVTISSEDGENWTASAGGKTSSWKAEVMAYPDVRRAVPTKTTGEYIQFDAKQFEAFVKVHAALGGGPKKSDSVLLAPNGAGSTALVHLPYFPDFVGALSPLRNTEARDHAPHWVHATNG